MSYTQPVYASITTSGSNASWGTFYQPQTHTYAVPAEALTPKENTVPNPVAGGAPGKTLFTRYITTVGGYRGQVVWGDQERPNGTDQSVLWESPVVKGEDGRTKALAAADKKLATALALLFS